MIFSVYIGTIATSPILDFFFDRVTGYKFMALKVYISAQLVSPTVNSPNTDLHRHDRSFTGTCPAGKALWDIADGRIAKVDLIT